MPARMFPARLPAEVLADPRRTAERRVYEALRDTLPASFSVLYSFSWLTAGRDGRKHDGEADFVIAHAQKPLLVLEVKGGRVGRASGEWYSIDRSGSRHAIKNPVDQGRKGRFALLEKLKSLPGLRERFVPIGHGVALPGCGRHGADLGPDAPREIFAFAEDMANLGRRVGEILDYWTNKERAEPPGADLIAKLEALLAPTFELRMPLGAALAEDERKILELTEEQFSALDMLSCMRRVAVSGGAGTGKTLLALEKAKRLAAEGFETLLTCFNRPLAEHLHRSAGNMERLTILNFHRLCEKLANEAMVTTHAASLDEHFKNLPSALGAALDARPERRFDAIVVDEGQDFAEEWWIPLQLALRDPNDGILYVFHDENQRIYRRASTFPEELAPIQLTKNLRNTQPIHALARRYWSGGEFVAVGPEGRAVQFEELPRPQDLEKTVSRVLHRLLREDSVAADEVAVLSGLALKKSQLGRRGQIGTFAVTTDQEAEPGKVLLDTIHSFKGLERPVVVLVELEDVLANDELVYVGLTRARAHLVLVGTRATLDALRAK
jgi:hypothetical protein